MSKRPIRTLTVAVATVLAGLGWTALPTGAHATGADGYEYGGLVRLTGSATDEVGELVSELVAVAGSCVPKKHVTTIYEPTARVYYGLLDSIYVWQDLAEAETIGCANPVKIRVQMFDQPLNGADLPATGAPAEGSGAGRAGAVATLLQRYQNVAMATGLSFHQLTTVVTATQSDGKTATAWCGKRTWTYLATLAGPSIVGSTPTEVSKCGA
ncbi:MAG TPA: hypothetical protein VNA20_09045 [Frankiaceae bacterium]|nr:hypothetical protein [Frankiaceae bacterium]